MPAPPDDHGSDDRRAGEAGDGAEPAELDERKIRPSQREAARRAARDEARGRVAPDDDERPPIAWRRLVLAVVGLIVGGLVVVIGVDLLTSGGDEPEPGGGPAPVTVPATSPHPPPANAGTTTAPPAVPR